MNAITAIQKQSSTTPSEKHVSYASQAELEELVRSGALSLGSLAKKVAAARMHYERKATAEEIEQEYRMLFAVTARSKQSVQDLTYMAVTFANDAQAGNITLYDLRAGMKAYRDSGEDFTPRTYGQWCKTVRTQNIATGMELFDQFRTRANHVRGAFMSRQERTDNGGRDVEDLNGRHRDALVLMELARRQSARNTYNLSSLPDLIRDLKEQLHLVRAVPLDRHMKIEKEAIARAESELKAAIKKRSAA